MPPVTEAPATVPDTSTAHESHDGSDGASAAEALAPFIAAAAEADRNIAAAAAAVNASFNGEVVTFDAPTVALVAAAEPSAVGAAIPPGLHPDLERALLLVYSDLDSRFAALHGESCVQPGTFSVDTIDPHCFVEGHAAAVRTHSDIEAAQALASASSAPATVPAGSPAAAEPAVRVAYIQGNNEGCGSHGGFVATAPIDVHWSDPSAMVAAGSSLDGTAGGVNFTASYGGGADWTMHFRAC